MAMEKVNSSNVDEIGYNAETKTLSVRFKNGGLYHYHLVEPEKYEALKNADSIGSHLHKHIKPHHSFRRDDGR